MDLLHVEHQMMEKTMQVRQLLLQEMEPLDSLLLIDTLQRLSIDYLFQEEINVLLSVQYRRSNGQSTTTFENLYGVALEFRLLRQQGYYVSPDVFDQFKDRSGRFKPELIGDDIAGMLCLYEASHLGIEGEDSLVDAGSFARKQLEDCVMEMEPDLARQTKHTLENPFHLTLPKYNTKFYLETSQGALGRIPVLLHELAKLDFNIVQAMNQRELKEVFTWWRELGLAKELKFARDQPLKWFMWSLATLPNPKFSKYRVEITKPIAFVYLIDDIFDNFGTLEELILFTDAINKWDINSIERLPKCMQLCFKALYETTNGIADMVLNEHGWNPIDILTKSWAGLCNAFLQEAKWFTRGCLPKADEYLRNGVISSGVPMVLIHLFTLLEERIELDSVDIVDNIPDLLSCPATILRLWDDLGSAKDEGQEGYDGSYIDCYMKERGYSSSVESTREHVMHMIFKSWMKLNKACLSPNTCSPASTIASLNAARMVQVMYSYNEKQGLVALRQHIDSLLGESIPM